MFLKKMRATLCAAAVGLGIMSAVPVQALPDYAKTLQAEDLRNASAFVLGEQGYVDNKLDLNADNLVGVSDEVIIKRILIGEYKFSDPVGEFNDITANELLNQVVIGWNLGNTLDATTTSWLPNPTPAQSERAWGNPITTKAMIDGVKAGGFNLIRIPTSWLDHMESSPDYKIDDDWMARVKEVVDYVLEDDDGTYCILNLHHENDWLIPTYAEQSGVQQRLVAMWTQIAEEFKDYDERLIFEAMNEPRLINHPNEWNGGTQEARLVINSYNQTVVDTVRATGGNNAKRILMVPTYAASCISSTVNDFVMPRDTVANKLIVSIHSYSPYNFALNGEGTSSFTDSDKSGLQWEIQNIHDSFVAKGMPVMIGEFGAQNKENLEDRVRWAEYYVKTAKSYGLKCVWWDNNLFSGSGEKFGIFNRSTLQFEPVELLDALIRGANS